MKHTVKKISALLLALLFALLCAVPALAEADGSVPPMQRIVLLASSYLELQSSTATAETLSFTFAGDTAAFTELLAQNELPLDCGDEGTVTVQGDFAYITLPATDENLELCRDLLGDLVGDVTHNPGYYFTLKDFTRIAPIVNGGSALHSGLVRTLLGDGSIWMIVLLGAILAVAIVIAVAIIKKKKPELPDGK